MKNRDYSFVGGFRVLGLGFRATQDYIGVKCGMKGGGGVYLAFCF